MRPATKLGLIGERGHASTLRELIEQSDASLCAVYLPHRRSSHPHGTMDFQALLGADGVVIASPDATHVEYVRRLRAAGFAGYLFVEKIPATSRAELGQLEALVDARTVFDFSLGRSPLATTLERWLRDDRIGQPVSACIRYGYGIAHRAEYASSWRADPALAPGGPLQLLGIHFLDLADRLFGPVCNYAARGHRHARVAATPDTWSAWLQHQSGTVTHVLVSYAIPATDQIEIIGTNGSITGDHAQLRLSRPREYLDPHGRYAPPPACQVETRQDDFVVGTRAAIRDFVQLVESGGAADRAEQQRALRSTALYLDLLEYALPG